MVLHTCKVVFISGFFAPFLPLPLGKTVACDRRICGTVFFIILIGLVFDSPISLINSSSAFCWAWANEADKARAISRPGSAVVWTWIKTLNKCHQSHHHVTPFRVRFQRTLWKVNKVEHLNIKTHSVQLKPPKELFYKIDLYNLYLNGWSSTWDITHKSTIWNPNLKKRGSSNGRFSDPPLYFLLAHLPFNGIESTTRSSCNRF